MPRHPQLSPTTSTLSSTVFSDLVKKAKEREGPIFPLHVGDTYREPLEAARAERQLTAEHPRLHNYAPVQGEPELLDAIVARMKERTGIERDRKQVQVMSGATAGLSVVAATILSPGDEVLLPAPFWPLIRGIIASRGATPVQVPFLDRIGSKGFDPEAELERRVTDRTVALYVNTPSNPTGRIIPSDVIDAMVKVAKRHDLWVVCDEAYEELWFGDEGPAPVWARGDLRDRAVAAHTLSKSYGLAGARVGWTHGPEGVMKAIRGAQTFMTYCSPRPMQFGAVHALRDGDGWLAEARRDYRKAGDAAADVLGIERPAGGTFLFFDAGPYLPDDADSCMPFLERCIEAGVLLTPGASCGEDYARWVRLCFTSVPMDELERALGALQPLVAKG
ncbi:MAG: pyridoxal phosphate-dependent aminotransferase [Polyangiales bacterium]